MSIIPSGAQNKFFGQKVSRLGVNVLNAIDSELIYKNDYTTTIYYNQAGSPTVLLGTRIANSTNGLSSDQQGFFVSKSGVDVTQATNTQLIFNSNSNFLNVVASQQITMPSCAANTAVSYTVNHNLGYIPIVSAFYEYQTGSYAQVPYTNYSSSLGVNWVIQCSYIDKYKLIFQLQTGTGNTFTANPLYYILQQNSAQPINID